LPRPNLPPLKIRSGSTLPPFCRSADRNSPALVTNRSRWDLTPPRRVRPGRRRTSMARPVQSSAASEPLAPSSSVLGWSFFTCTERTASANLVRFTTTSAQADWVA
jgi:hypothetical protein